MNHVELMLENYVNGNLSDAKKQARRHTHRTIREALQDRGHSVAVACAVADYLKGQGSYQTAADLEYAEKTANATTH